MSTAHDTIVQIHGIERPTFESQQLIHGPLSYKSAEWTPAFNSGFGFAGDQHHERRRFYLRDYEGETYLGVMPSVNGIEWALHKYEDNKQMIPVVTGSHQLDTNRAIEATKICSEMSRLIVTGRDTYETHSQLSTFRRDIKSVGIRLSRAQETCRPNTWVSINPEFNAFSFVDPPGPSTEQDQEPDPTEGQDVGHSDHLTESATKDDGNQANVAGPDSDKLLLLRWRAASGCRAD